MDVLLLWMSVQINNGLLCLSALKIHLFKFKEYGCWIFSFSTFVLTCFNHFFSNFRGNSISWPWGEVLISWQKWSQSKFMQDKSDYHIRETNKNMSSLCHNDKHSVDKVIIYVLLKYLMLKGHPHCFVLLCS